MSKPRRVQRKLSKGDVMNRVSFCVTRYFMSVSFFDDMNVMLAELIHDPLRDDRVGAKDFPLFVGDMDCFMPLCGIPLRQVIFKEVDGLFGKMTRMDISNESGGASIVYDHQSTHWSWI